MTREPWLTKRELSAIIKVSTSTIERHKYPCVKVGRQNRYFLSEVERHLRGEAAADNVVPLRREDQAA